MIPRCEEDEIGDESWTRNWEERVGYASRMARTIFSFVIVLLVTFAVAPRAGHAAADIGRPNEAEREVGKMLDAWHAAAASADEDSYFAHLAADAVFMGTDATERWNVEQFRAFAHPYFAKGKAWTFKAVSRHITIAPDARIGWFDELLDTANMGECRGSGVVIEKDGRWRIAQYNLSIPIPNALVDDFVSRIAKHADAAPVDADQIRILSFNIRYDNRGDGEDRWERRRENVVRFIRDDKFDVVGLQEALHSQLEFLTAQLPEMGVIGVGRDDGKTRGEYAAILYRKDRWRVDLSGDFWLSDTPDVAGSKHWGNRVVRICTWARFVPVDPAHGAAFYHFNVHLDHESQPARERGVALMLERIAARKHADPVVVTGDFNAGEDNRAILGMKGEVPMADLAPNGAEVEKKRMKFTDAFRAAHPDERTVGTFNSFRGQQDGDKIDYIFVQPGVGVTKADIHRERPGGRDLSDHFPISATIVLPPANH